MTDMGIVLLPGLDGTGLLFRPLLESLPSRLSPTVVSYPLESRLGYRELLPVVLSSLPRSLPFVLLGESFSGPLALMAAATRPEGLRAVVLCATFVRNPLPRASGWLKYIAHPFALRLVPKILQRRVLLGSHTTPALRLLLNEALSKTSPGVFASRFRSILSVDVREELRSCPVPILYLAGSEDRLVSPSNLQTIIDTNHAVRVARFSAPHLLLQAQPAAATSAILAFIGETLAA